MDWLLLSISTALANSLLLALIYFYVYSRGSDRRVRTWSVAWAIYSCRFVFDLTALLGGGHSILPFLSQVSTLLSAYVFLRAACLWHEKTIPRPWTFLSVLLAGFLSLELVWKIAFPPSVFLVFVFAGLVNIWMGVLFLQRVSEKGRLSIPIGWGLILWGLHKFNYPFLKDIPQAAPWGYWIGALLLLLVGIGILLQYYKRFHLAFDEIHNRYQMFFEKNHAVMLLIDPVSGQILDGNLSATEYYGYNREQLASMNISTINVLPPEQVTHEMQQAVSRQKKSFFFQHRLASGEIRDVEVNSGPIEIEGKVLLYSIVHDVTERKTIEQALGESEAKYRLLFEKMLNGFALHEMIYDQEGRPVDYRFLTINPAFEKMTGLPAERVLGMRASEVLPRIEPYWIEAFGKAALTGEPVYLENYAQDLDRYFEAYAYSPRKDQFAVIFSNVTDRKRAELLLKDLNQTLEGRVRKRTKALVRHQKKLQALTKDLTLTEQRARKRLAEEMHDYLAQMLVVGKMNLSRVRTSLPTPALQESLRNVEEILDQSLKYTRTLIADLSPTILYEAGFLPAIHWLAQHMISHHLHVQVRCSEENIPMDEEQALLVFQVVRELFFNIIKHAQVQEAAITLLREEDRSLVILVEDQGVGLERAGKKEKDANSGQFGLFSIRERLKSIGGSFEIKTGTPGGTTARITVPLQASTETLPHPIPQTAPGKRFSTPVRPDPAPAPDAIRVLLVDDHQMVREGLGKVVESYPELKLVGEAEDGLEAVEKALATKPDVIVMDLNMPKMNGIEAAKRIKALLPDVVIIGLSMHDDPELAARMMQAGAACYLTKGGPSEELYQAILSAFRNNQETVSAKQ